MGIEEGEGYRCGLSDSVSRIIGGVEGVVVGS
jgi:hypothetical protein